MYSLRAGFFEDACAGRDGGAGGDDVIDEEKVLAANARGDGEGLFQVVHVVLPKALAMSDLAQGGFGAPQPTKAQCFARQAGEAFAQQNCLVKTALHIAPAVQRHRYNIVRQGVEEATQLFLPELGEGESQLRVGLIFKAVHGCGDGLLIGKEGMDAFKSRRCFEAEGAQAVSGFGPHAQRAMGGRRGPKLCAARSAEESFLAGRLFAPGTQRNHPQLAPFHVSLQQPRPQQVWSLSEKPPAVHLPGLSQPHDAAQSRGDVGQNAGPEFLAAKVRVHEVKRHRT